MRNPVMLKICIVFAILIFTSCTQQQKKKELPVFVKTTEIRKIESVLTKKYPARIKSASEVKLSFRVAGPILKVNIEEGDTVNKGDVIAQIDPRDYRIQLQATEAKYHEVKSEVERITALYQKNKISENDYDKAVSGLKQITAKYEAHKNALEDTKLRAPFSGHISKIFFEQGETVDAGMPIISIYNNKAFEIIAHLPASDFLKKKDFTRFSCQSSSLPGEEWPLELRNIVSQANLNGLYPAYFSLKADAGEIILPGMSAEVIIEYQTDKEPIFELPSPAIFEQSGNASVWIFNEEDETVITKTIEIIKVNTSGIAVVKGDFEGNEIIVTAGVNSLKEGQKVRRLPEPSESNVGGLL
ncbi:efflux RND transporter periplasmic adaptor subunit [Marinilabilia salmonicolor]|jgi:RND family efflux transporter MFP subunit|uniref:RND family efflux transporter MFP subunit n=1 Tax=Marinilabilia salmonicolor TaxID=989 RepID=A0A368V2D0_9BACT|nr:efflux RND transporter periplasmic adaptor subunit [Marinilabilia salmonicolor]RCW34515.1 RND family efflux transporter MFP subunit [Marinilabilia salmonicolor]